MKVYGGGAGAPHFRTSDLARQLAVYRQFKCLPSVYAGVVSSAFGSFVGVASLRRRRLVASSPLTRIQPERRGLHTLNVDGDARYRRVDDITHITNRRPARGA